MKQLVITAALVLVVAGASQAQQTQASGRGQTQQVQKPVLPAEMIPPPGMCRVWLKDVPAKQQPAPTDCATATRTKPVSAYVYYGDDYAKKTPVKAPATKTIVSPQITKPPVIIKPPGE